MKLQTASARPQDANPSPTAESPEELYEETLSSLVQAWEVNVDGIDISSWVMNVINTESEDPYPPGQESGQVPAQFIPFLQDDYAGYPALTTEQEQRLARAVERGETWGKLVLVRANRLLVDNVAEEFKNRLVETDELIREGMIGLAEAAERFDPTRGFRFSTVATQWVRQVLGRFVRSRIHQSAMAVVSKRQALKMGIPSIDLTTHKPEHEALQAVSAEFAQQNAVLPIRRDGNRLWVAMRNPRDIAVVDDVRMTSRCLVQPMIADPVELDRAIAEAYGSLEPPHPPVPPTAIAAPAPEPADEMTRLLRETLVEMRGMRDELSSLRREVAELRRDRSATVPRPSTARLFPFAPPESASQRNR